MHRCNYKSLKHIRLDIVLLWYAAN
uniref:Uncharacterized protein n=1 Tax=Arundo donax TaxID=35708 RepID=A0A0A8YMJ6_ARUDO